MILLSVLLEGFGQTNLLSLQEISNEVLNVKVLAMERYVAEQRIIIKKAW